MMENKLSELSNPKAFVVTGGKMYQDRAFTDKSTAERSKADRHDGAVVEPLYSQEYVSALDKVAQYWIGESAGLKKRAEDAERRIAELEAKLATPVRLPDIRSDDYHETGWFQHMKYYRDVERSLRAAGFTVEGDE